MELCYAEESFTRYTVILGTIASTHRVICTRMSWCTGLPVWTCSCRTFYGISLISEYYMY